MPSPRQWNENGHAIVSAAFAVIFASNPTPQTIRELLALHSKIKEDYPRRQESTGRVIGFRTDTLVEDEEVHTEVGDPVLSGFTFDSLKADGQIMRSITLNENKLSIVRTDYDSWEKTWGEVREVLVLMLPVALERLDVAAFQLQYHDRFVWEGEQADFRADIIFRRDSEFLAPNVFEVKDLWHSNHGYFEYPDQPHKHQLLTVSDVQVIPPGRAELDTGPWLLADVKFNHRAFHGVERAGGQGTGIKSVEEVLGAEGATGLIDSYMNEMHDRDKQLLARLINDEMCDRIKLDRPG